MVVPQTFTLNSESDTEPRQRLLLQHPVNPKHRHHRLYHPHHEDKAQK